jgi:hypothetical protein
MSFEDTLTDTIARLRQNQFQNEQGVVPHIPSEPGWDTEESLDMECRVANGNASGTRHSLFGTRNFSAAITAYSGRNGKLILRSKSYPYHDTRIPTPSPRSACPSRRA